MGVACYSDINMVTGVKQRAHSYVWTCESKSILHNFDWHFRCTTTYPKNHAHVACFFQVLWPHAGGFFPNLPGFLHRKEVTILNDCPSELILKYMKYDYINHNIWISFQLLTASAFESTEEMTILKHLRNQVSRNKNLRCRNIQNFSHNISIACK